MRLTKIYFRRFSKVAVLAGGIVAGAAIASVLQPAPVTQVIEPEPVAAGGEKETGSIASVFDKDKEPGTLAERFEGFVITGIAQDKAGQVIYSMISNGEKQYNVDSLRSMGLVVRLVNKCEILVMNQDRSENVRLYTSYCGPDKPPVTPPKMSPAERYKWKLEQVRAVERLNG